jgi:ABC-type Mn2+/Zn2+ transport system permease subunit
MSDPFGLNDPLRAGRRPSNVSLFLVVAVAVAIAALFGLGALLALSPDVPARLSELLFGDPLSTRPLDLIAAAVLLVGGGLALAALHRPLTLAAFDPQAARALGISPGRVLVALLVLVGITVAVAVQGLGNLLLFALIVAPAAEELFFRGILFRALRDHHGPSIAVAGSAGAFGLVHYVPGSSVGIVVVVAGTAAMGVGLAIQLERRRTLLAPVVAHVAFNALGLLIILRT